MNTITNFRVPLGRWLILPAGRLSTFQEGLLFGVLCIKLVRMASCGSVTSSTGQSTFTLHVTSLDYACTTLGPGKQGSSRLPFGVFCRHTWCSSGAVGAPFDSPCYRFPRLGVLLCSES